MLLRQRMVVPDTNVLMMIQLMVVIAYGMYIKIKMNHLALIQNILRQRLVIQHPINLVNNLQDQYIKADKKQVGGYI